MVVQRIQLLLGTKMVKYNKKNKIILNINTANRRKIGQNYLKIKQQKRDSKLLLNKYKLLRNILTVKRSGEQIRSLLIFLFSILTKFYD